MTTPRNGSGRVVTGDRFYVRRLGVPMTARQFVLVDRRGRRREWGSVAGAVRALRDAGEDPAGWQLMRGTDSGFGFRYWSAVPGSVADHCHE